MHIYNNNSKSNNNKHMQHVYNHKYETQKLQEIA